MNKIALALLRAMDSYKGIGPVRTHAHIERAMRNGADEIERLRLLAERLAPEEGMTQDEQGGCCWCGAGQIMDDMRKIAHMADCPWAALRQHGGTE